MGFADNSTETLLKTRERLLNGLDILARHLDAGTFDQAKKKGSVPPSQFGQIGLIFLLGVEDELEARILGFQRVLDPKLLDKAM